METLKMAGLIAGAWLALGAPAQADDYDWDDIFAPYRQRLDTATSGSGNAQNVNSAVQVITPWPPYVHNRRIPGNGARMVGAIERYRNPHPLAPGGAALQAENPLASKPDAGGGASGGAGQGGAADQSGQPAQ